MNGREDYARPHAEPAPARRRGGNGGTLGLEDDIERHRANIDQTLSELESKLTPGELIEQGLKRMGSGTGGFLHSFSQAATHNPVPMALVGVGLAWMMFGGQGEHPRKGRGTSESDEPSIDPGIPELDDFRDVYLFCLQQEHPFDPDQLECILYEDLGPEILAGYEPHPSIRGGGSDWADRWGGVGASEGAGHQPGLGERTKEATQKARDEALSRIYKTRSRMAEGSAEAKERLDRARAEAWRRAKRAQAAVDRKAREAKRRVSEIVDRYPLSVVALGVAAGAAMGGALPETETEDRLIGAKSDVLKGRAKEQARQQAEQVKDMAAAAGAAAKEEARAQGLDAEHARKQARTLKDKAGRVVTSAREESEHEGMTGESASEQVHAMREKAERVAAAARDAAREQRGAH